MLADEALKTAICALVARAAPGAMPGAIEELHGGASVRRFFRVHYRGSEHADEARAIAMFVPEHAPERKLAREQQRRWPFLEVRELLSERGVPVPRLLADDLEAGWLLVEDLGDDTIAEYLRRHPEQLERVYRRAVADLATAQARLAQLPADSVVTTRAFDHALLSWEIDHFREWGLDARGEPLSAAERAVFERARDQLVQAVAELPRGFVHRDYQSRNLMLRAQGSDFELVWIDFQDAMLGPRAYDLVALLMDSYRALPPAFIAARLDEYAALAGLDASERAALRREFLLITVQRKLKDAGRFVFIQHHKQDASFLPFFEPTLRNVQRALRELCAAPASATPSSRDVELTDRLRELDALLERRFGAAPEKQSTHG